MSALVLLSGGMDSATAAFWAKKKYDDVDAVSFNYSQRHHKELDAAAAIAAYLDIFHDVIDISDFGEQLIGSSLTDPDIDVPEGHYADETMRLTVVPNRNAVMLNMAISIAIARKHNRVIAGMHAGDHAIYPDCRPPFIDALNELAAVANEGFLPEDFKVVAPFLHTDKTGIANQGEALGVPWHLTWSCYKGETYHCGKCGTCVERREAFSLAGITDRTEYA